MSARHPIRLKQSQQGITLVLISLILLILIGMGAFAIDLNHQVLNKSRLQNAVDSAALAAAVVADDAEDANLAVQLAETAAINALNNFVDSTGNRALSTEEGDGIGGEVSITFSNTKEKGSFVSASAFTPDDDKDGDYDVYVRVAVSNVNLTQYLSYIFGGNKNVSASAVAGPSAAIAGTCNVSPIAMCADPAESAKSAWGYIPTDNPDYNAKTDRDPDTINVLKPSSHKDGEIGAGNYNLLDFGSGKNTVEALLAGDTEECLYEGDKVVTEPGKGVGPVEDGLNSRFDGGTTKSGKVIKPDKYLEESDVTKDDYETEYANDTSKAFYYKDYLDAINSCENGGECNDYYQSDGLEGRRILRVPIVKCVELPKDGKVSLDVLGIGCFFVTQRVGKKGNESDIFGQFLEDCTVKNASTGVDPSSTTGPHKIQLYKDPDGGAS